MRAIQTMSLKELYMIINGSSGWACVNEDNVALLHALSLLFFLSLREEVSHRLEKGKFVQPLC
jgi:hypothetical protein